jgi:hypothetical protein
MASASAVTVSQAQANLPKLIRQDSFAIARHGKVVGVFLSKNRIEALVESMELLKLEAQGVKWVRGDECHGTWGKGNGN